MQVLIGREEVLDRHEQRGIVFVYVVERRERRVQHFVLDDRIGERVLEYLLFRSSVRWLVGCSAHIGALLPFPIGLVHMFVAGWIP